MDVIDRMLARSDEVRARYNDRTATRQTRQEQLNAGNLLAVDERARVEGRLRRLSIDPTELSSGTGGLESLDDSRETVAWSALERILGNDDLIDVCFLTRGSQAARSIARINIVSNGKPAGFGTGFLVSPRLMLTNNHVLDSRATARESFCEFNYESDERGLLRQTTRFALCPDEFFVTDETLDFALVAVESRNEHDQQLADFGYLVMDPSADKVIAGEKLNIIQHPNGDLKRLALRDNLLEDILDDFLHYKTDTAPGSSGSPVFNDQWEVVALHHAGVPMRDAEGRFLTWDGEVWNRAMGTQRLGWAANEGVRISRIVAFVKEQPLSEAESDLLREMVESGEHAQPPSIGIIAAHGAPGLQATASNDAGGNGVNGDGAVGDKSELDKRLEDVDAAKERVYYDAAQDDRDRAAYYEALGIVLEEETAGATLSFQVATTDGRRVTVTVEAAPNGAESSNALAPGFETLSRHIAGTHAAELRYEPSKHVYPWVDWHPDGLLRSIYSGKSYDPKEFILEDFAIEAQRKVQFEEMVLQEGSMSDDARELARLMLESSLPFNCEHVVPQSWFGHKEPMRGDLHHLFACESGCNSFRANIPYFDFDDFMEATRSDCGKRLGDKFEPESGKGVIARATFYFLLRYPGMIGDSERELALERLPLLLRWHRVHPVSDYERHRNMVIFGMQGNRNPFIDFPHWAEQIDLRLGFGSAENGPA